MKSPMKFSRRCSSHSCSHFLTIFAITLLDLALIVMFYYNSGAWTQIKQLPNMTLTEPQQKCSEQLVDKEVFKGFHIKSAMQGKPASVHIYQDDVRLVDFVVQSGLILPPALPGTSYNLKEPHVLDPALGQGLTKAVLEVLKNMTGGFFIECGALDGETRSNTLYMERELGWSGLLVEADPSNFKLLQEKRRKAHSVNACLATKRYAHEVMFRKAFHVGKIADVNPDSAANNKFDHRLARVQCIPLYTLLLALNVTTVDYFSLDVEGAEFDVLRTIPFDKIFIRVLSVEFVHDPVPKERIADYMARFGYTVEAEVTGWAGDFVFVHESVYPSAESMHGRLTDVDEEFTSN